MPQRLDRRDLDDLDFVDAEELQSSGSGNVYRSNVVILSTTGSTRQVRISGWDVIHGDDDDYLQVGDIFVLSGSIPAQPSSSYRVDSIIDSGTFTVSPSILSSVFGTGSFSYPPGAARIGFDKRDISSIITTGSNIQDVIYDIGRSLGTGVVTGVPPNYVSTSSEGTSTTTSTSFQTKLSLPFFSNQSGTFYVLWYNESAPSAANKQYEVQVTFDGEEVGLAVLRPSLQIFSPFPGYILSGSTALPVRAGGHTASINFRAVDSTTVSIKRSRLGAWRVQ